MSALRRLLAVLLLTGCAYTPPMLFTPITHADGSRTWSYAIDMKIIPAGDMALPRNQRDEKLVGASIAFYDFCRKWEITDSREANGRLSIEGRCL